MLPTAIRILPLSRTREPEAFGSIANAVEFFCNDLPCRRPKGRFNIPSDTKFKKGSLVLFQYMERQNVSLVIAHALLTSNGCVYSNGEKGYVGYYIFKPESINVYQNPVTKEEIQKIWQKKLGARARLALDVAQYYEYMNLLKSKGNTRSKCTM